MIAYDREPAYPGSPSASGGSPVQQRAGQRLAPTTLIQHWNPEAKKWLTPLFDATGVRLRRVPFSAARVLAALKAQLAGFCRLAVAIRVAYAYEHAMLVRRIRRIGRLREVEPQVPGGIQLLGRHVAEVEIVVTEHLHLNLGPDEPADVAPLRRTDVRARQVG